MLEDVFQLFRSEHALAPGEQPLRIRARDLLAGSGIQLAELPFQLTQQKKGFAILESLLESLLKPFLAAFPDTHPAAFFQSDKAAFLAQLTVPLFNSLFQHGSEILQPNGSRDRRLPSAARQQDVIEPHQHSPPERAILLAAQQRNQPIRPSHDALWRRRRLFTTCRQK